MNKKNKPSRVHAFIDAQNLNQSLKHQGWDYDVFKFRQYLRDKYNVTHAFFFMGYISKYQSLYAKIQQAGFIVQFKEILTTADNNVKGNIDVNLTLHAAETNNEYDKAILVSADGDFYPLLVYWKKKGKFLCVISPSKKRNTSQLLKKYAKGKLVYMPTDIKNKIERRK